MTESSYVDRFAAEHLPPREQWPDFVFDLPELQYPPTVNCVAELLDRHVAEGRGERTAIVSRGLRWTYAELQQRVDRIAHVLRDQLALPTGSRVLLRGDNNPMMAACL